jgi:tRNA-Thr(GGU) m(6)t(6)A37 methyltransferase TsaA
MMDEVIVKPIGRVISGRNSMDDDYWGNQLSIIEIDSSQFSPEVLAGLEEFSHLEVIFFMHGVNPKKIETTARHPRNNQAWPKVGIFSQRPKARPNRLGLSRCKIVRIENHTITVEALDAIQGTPILDIKPYMKEFGPIGEIEQPEWATELMKMYYQQKEAALIKVTNLVEWNLDILLRESEKEGYRFVRKLLNQYETGENCFEKTGEVLYVAVIHNEVVGVCGLNQDPYCGKGHVGRVRHLFVRSTFRNQGIAGRLLDKIKEEANEHFTVLTLRTSNPIADKFYRSIGFISDANTFPSSTHYYNVK